MGREDFPTVERKRVVDSRNIAVVIPTFGRHEVLIETVERELELRPPPAEVIVVDQTPRHAPGVEQTLARRRWEQTTTRAECRESGPEKPPKSATLLSIGDVRPPLGHEGGGDPRSGHPLKPQESQK
jgi:hypothetical protein